MFSLTIVFGPGPMVWTLMFKNADAAIAAAKNCQDNSTSETFETTDDLSQSVVISRTQIHGVMLEDLEQSKLAHIERALHQARTQAKGSEIADNDPILKQARHRAQGGMPMIQPMPAGYGPNGRFPS